MVETLYILIMILCTAKGGPDKDLYSCKYCTKNR